MYTYNNLLMDVKAFGDAGLVTGSIGKTALDFDIPFVFVGDKAAKCIIVQGAIHAREHITAELIIRLIREYQSKLSIDGTVCDMVSDLSGNNTSTAGGIYFIPMINIDGVRLVQEGLGFIKDESVQEFLLKVNGDNNDFTTWKANARAVDLNTNFPARWGKGAQNVFKASPANFVGEQPASESETRALMDFSRLVKPAATISYHIRGEEIFWEFFQEAKSKARDKVIATRLAALTGYARLDGDGGSVGGYKDWCIAEFGIPSFTIEVGKMRHPFPYPYSDLNRIFEANRKVPEVLLGSL